MAVLKEMVWNICKERWEVSSLLSKASGCGVLRRGLTRPPTNMFYIRCRIGSLGPSSLCTTSVLL